MAILFIIFLLALCLVADIFGKIKRLFTNKPNKKHINPDSETPFNDTELLTFDILEDEEE